MDTIVFFRDCNVWHWAYMFSGATCICFYKVNNKGLIHFIWQCVVLSLLRSNSFDVCVATLKLGLCPWGILIGCSEKPCHWGGWKSLWAKGLGPGNEDSVSKMAIKSYFLRKNIWGNIPLTLPAFPSHTWAFTAFWVFHGPQLDPMKPNTGFIPYSPSQLNYPCTK